MKRPRRVSVNLLSGQAAALWLLAALFLTGSIAGCIQAGLWAKDAAVTDYLDGYRAVLRQGAVSAGLLPVLWHVMRPLVAVFVLGLTALGVLGIPALLTVRGFCLSCACSVLIRLFGGRGMLLSLCLFGVSAVFWLPALLALGADAITNSYALMRRVTGQGRCALPVAAGPYWRRCCLCLALALGAAAAEYLIVPVLARLVLQLA